MATVTNFKHEELTLQQRISAILVKNRTLIIGVIVAVFVVIASLIAVTVISDGKREAAYEKIESLMEQWNTAKSNQSETLTATEDEVLGELTKVAASNSRSFAGARAEMAIAEIYFSRKDWTNAQAQYLAAEASAPAAYTAGLNLFNAAVCAEELGNADTAVEYLEKAIAMENFSMKTRALFNIGRIEEGKGQIDKAKAAYERLTGDFAEDEWTNLAKSRLISLSLN